MATRDLLHVSRLQDFLAWCEARGWKRVDPRGPYEVARLASPPGQKGVALVHRRDRGAGSKEHLIVHGRSLDLAVAWLRERRAGKAADVPEELPRHLRRIE